MSELAPEAAAPKFDLAERAVTAPVPPWAIEIPVVSPVSEVMSEFAPAAAAPMFVLAAVAVVAPVPP